MKKVYITEQELEYLVNIPVNVSDALIPYGLQMSFEEAVKACNGITLEQFSKNLDEAIKRVMPNP